MVSSVFWHRCTELVLVSVSTKLSVLPPTPATITYARARPTMMLKHRVLASSTTAAAMASASMLYVGSSEMEAIASMSAIVCLSLLGRAKGN